MNYLELKQKIEAMEPEQQKCAVTIQLGWDRDFFDVEQLEFADEQDGLPQDYPYLSVLGAFPAVGIRAKCVRLINHFLGRFRKDF